MKDMAYRQLTDQEIKILMQQGCRADDWANVAVKDGFNTEHVQQTAFIGNVKLGLFGDDVEVEKGLTRHAGLYNCTIQQCEIGDHVYIGNVGHISNYAIEDHVVIIHTGSVSVSEVSAFGNGTEIEVLSETGGRELILFDLLSAQLAYMLVFYRHDPELTEKLKFMIHSSASSVKSGTGQIGSFTTIHRTGVLRNVRIGSHAKVSGAQLIEEATLVSNKQAPVNIGESVIVKKSVILSGSSVTDGAYLEKCFVGQGVTIGRQFSAENSAFFANTEVALGEACSVFAGPYTVSHHKSTLLLAAMFSFYNAGSGTNISNHMYKLGPLHQGIVERGSKTGSSSYMLWPCRVGAYSVVVGKHFANFDTSDFPFSYVVDEKGKSVLYPAMNLFTVGTRRDSEKWPVRDRRTDVEKYDLICFDLFNPYIAGKMTGAMKLLGEFAEKALKTQDYVNYKGTHIPRLLLKTSRKFYEMALKVYLGKMVTKRFETDAGELSLNRIREMLASQGNSGRGEWRDISGMIAPADEIERLTEGIKDGSLKSVDEVLKKLKEIHCQYDRYAWNWCSAYLEAETGLKTHQISVEILIQIITEWQANAVKFNNMILQDAAKEFDMTSRYGFGIDGDENINRLDFEAVRGTFQENKFVSSLKAEIENINKRATKLIAMLQIIA
jgi:carbonic anhydrase/acetyltransferase-like protein (isoleucine patch superfamily)